MIAALAATAAGIGGLLLDHTIAVADYPRSAMGWFVGDEVALLAFAPFLLIHVVPWVRPTTCIQFGAAPTPFHQGVEPHSLSEAIAQALSIAAILWIMFGRTFAPYELFYLCFTPIIWVAVAQRHFARCHCHTGSRFRNRHRLAFSFQRLPMSWPKSVCSCWLFPLPGLSSDRPSPSVNSLKRELRQRSVYLDSLVENSPLGIVALDRAGNVELCNRAFEDLFGFHRTELAGRPFDSVVGTGEHDHPLELSPRFTPANPSGHHSAKTK